MHQSLLLGLLVAALGLSACASSPPEVVSDACEIFDEKRGWYRATARAERRHDVPKELILAIIRQESSFEANAKPARGRFLFVFPGRRPSSAEGFAQALDGTWDTYRNDTGRRGADRNNFADASDFVGWYVARTSRQTGLRRDDAYSQYLAYHEGVGGFQRGTYRSKPTVRRSAERVASVKATYVRQLNGCERQFRRGVPLVPLI